MGFDIGYYAAGADGTDLIYWGIGGALIGAAVGAAIGATISYAATGSATASFSEIKAGFMAKKVADVSLSSTPVNSPTNPLEKIQYTEKVKQQMLLGDNHNFPSIVDNYEAYGKQTSIVGNDGLPYTKLEILGSYNGKSGVFEYIYDANNICNHRFFRLF